MKRMFKKALCLILSTGILLVNGVSSVVAAEFSTDGKTYYGGHYYKVYTDAASWDDAKSRCELLGGHLATITTKEEDDFVYALMCTAGIDKALFGLYNAGDSEKPDWRWVTNEILEYTRWGSGEPNYDYGGTEAYGGYYLGAWNDYRNDEVNAYICEWDTENSDSSDRNQIQLHNYSFPYNNASYLSTAYNSAEDNDNWVDIRQTTISSGSFDWLNAITSTISMNSGSALQNNTWKESQFYSDPNNSNAISGYGEKNASFIWYPYRIILCRTDTLVK